METVIQWQASAGYLSGYGGETKKLPSFSWVLTYLKSNYPFFSLIIYMWDFLIVSLRLDKIILQKLVRSFLLGTKYFYFDGIFLFYFYTL